MFLFGSCCSTHTYDSIYAYAGHSLINIRERRESAVLVEEMPLGQTRAMQRLDKGHPGRCTRGAGQNNPSPKCVRVPCDAPSRHKRYNTVFFTIIIFSSNYNNSILFHFFPRNKRVSRKNSHVLFFKKIDKTWNLF